MKDFERFKKKVLREHIFRAVLIGLGIGLLAAAFAIVISFLTNPSIAVVVGIVAGLSVGGAGGYYYWYKCKPTDKKIALRLDKKLGLHERTATMIEYAEKEGAIVEKQRDDAQEKLAEKPTNALPFTVSIWIIPALAIAGAFFTASFFTPQNKNEQGGNSLNSSSGFDIDSATHSIAEDYKSNMDKDLDSSVAEAMKSVIEKLESQLSGISDADIRESYVNQAKSEIDDIVDDATSREIIGKALKTESDQHLKDMGQALVDGNSQAMRNALQDLYTELYNLNGQDLVNYANNVADQIEDALAKAVASGVSTDDDMYKSLKALADSLRSISEKRENASDAPQSGAQQSGQQQSGQQQSGQSGQQQSGQSGESGESGDAPMSYRPNQADSEAKDAMQSIIENAADKIQSELAEQSRIEQEGSEAKDAMDSMINPQPGSESGSGSGSGQTTTEGSGPGSGSTTEGPGSGSTTEGSGQGSEGSGEGSGSGEGQGSGQGSGSGEGSGAGQGTDGSDKHTDTIYTGNGTVEYGSVINSYQGGYVDDHRENGTNDDEAGDAADEYFKDLYGSEAGQTGGGTGGNGGTGGGLGGLGGLGGKGGK